MTVIYGLPPFQSQNSPRQTGDIVTVAALIDYHKNNQLKSLKIHDDDSTEVQEKQIQDVIDVVYEVEQNFRKRLEALPPPNDGTFIDVEKELHELMQPIMETVVYTGLAEMMRKELLEIQEPLDEVTNLVLRSHETRQQNRQQSEEEFIEEFANLIKFPEN